MYKIVTKKELAPKVKLYEIEAPLIAKKRKPGQFVIIRLHNEGERIPLTIAGSDNDKGTITLIVQEVGKTTIELSHFNEGDTILDVVGPLGKPTHIENFGTAVVVGGGIGLAVALPMAKALKETGNEVISIMGARNKELLILEDELKENSDELIITTDDGSYGRKGLVTNALQELIDSGKNIGIVIAIGPVVMMKFVAKTTEPYKIHTVVSLNPIMIDGTGMCGGCRVTIGNKMQFACVDGPEFDGHQVDFEELMKRLTMYNDFEKAAVERYEKRMHKCKIGM